MDYVGNYYVWLINNIFKYLFEGELITLWSTSLRNTRTENRSKNPGSYNDRISKVLQQEISIIVPEEPSLL